VVEGEGGENGAHGAHPFLELTEGAGEDVVDREIVVINFPTHQNTEILKVVNNFDSPPMKEANHSLVPSVREDRGEELGLIVVDPKT
jgi:hypothetical protein